MSHEKHREGRKSQRFEEVEAAPAAANSIVLKLGSHAVEAQENSNDVRRLHEAASVTFNRDKWDKWIEDVEFSDIPLD